MIPRGPRILSSLGAMSSPRVFRPSLRRSLLENLSYQLFSRRCLTSKVHRNKRTYDDAVGLLNTLQTPYAILKQRRDAGIRIDKLANQEMRRCLEGIGYNQSDLTRLNIVHVAGTKGKGSTCAFVASILNEYRKTCGIPKKVGMFTSPHLIAVRERIRINGAPLPAPLFAQYFFEVWDALETAAAKTDVPLEKPVYFRYLTLMSYHVFLREGVDAAIYETGVGGEYDSTNIVDCPAATGISTIGIDHTYSLGETIEEISWHKAGIQKTGVPSFAAELLPAVLEVIKQRAVERRVESLRVASPGRMFDLVNITPDEPFQRVNASLAVELAKVPLTKLGINIDGSKELPKQFVDGLEKVVWRGRCETKIEGSISWYLDGAHTVDSMKVVSAWVARKMNPEIRKPRVLIFNQQGEHGALQLLETLFTDLTVRGAKFNHVIFCANALRVVDGGNKKADFTNLGYDPKAIAALELQKALAEEWHALDPSPSTTIKVLPGIEDAIEYVRNLAPALDEEKEFKANKEVEVEALITGSVHLVGAALGVLEGVDAL